MHAFFQRAAVLALQALYLLWQFRPSVLHAPVLCQNDCTVRQQNVSSFLETKKNIQEGQPLPPEILTQTDPSPPESSEF